MTSRSTRLTSFKSSVTFGPPAFICAFNSSICSRRIRPISLSVVVRPSESFSILKVTFVFEPKGCTPSATGNLPDHRRFRFSLGPLFRRLLKIQPETAAVDFAPEERDVYSYEHTTKDLAPSGAKPSAESSLRQTKAIALLRNS